MWFDPATFLSPKYPPANFANFANFEDGEGAVEAKLAELAKLAATLSAENDDDSPRRRWLITLPDGELDVTCTPPATREEVLRGHPEALSAEPYQPSLDPPEAPLRAHDEARIRAWLASIGEEDTATIEEVMENCRTDAEARDYFLTRATEEQP